MSLGHFWFPEIKGIKRKTAGGFLMFTTKVTLKPKNRLGTPGEYKHPETGQDLEQTSIRVAVAV